MSQAQVPRDSGMLNLSGHTGVFDALSGSHEQIVEDNDATKAEAELCELAARNGEHDRAFDKKLAQICRVKKKGSFQKLIRNLRKLADQPEQPNKAAG
jgi:hypothetical protein